MPSGHYLREDLVEYQDPRTGDVEWFLMTLVFIAEQNEFVERFGWKVTESVRRDLEKRFSWIDLKQEVLAGRHHDDGVQSCLDSKWTVVKSRRQRRRQKQVDTEVFCGSKGRFYGGCRREEDWPLEIYAQDVFHGDHCRMHWTWCFNDWCSFHNGGKAEAGFLPRPTLLWQQERARFNVWRYGRSAEMN